ncbi:hypothetical protein [Lacihabitans soyangensis]|uniref:Uncharacterized protein n=1 Tax=Lacihabitans soyangensis TaxID=869394 RepID=A0AAE3H5H2_9BACT|nr:hypothetical protein [Lacihabitans soyangensis]MCP9765123.1 hypothetical protein [Lacihabitans soyangensis]
MAQFLNKERGIAIIGMPLHFGFIGEALIAAHRIKEDNIHFIDIANLPPATFKEIDDMNFALSKRNLDLEIPALCELVTNDFKRVKKPVNPEWKRRMKNLQNKN